VNQAYFFYSWLDLLKNFTYIVIFNLQKIWRRIYRSHAGIVMPRHDRLSSFARAIEFPAVLCLFH